MRRESDKLQHRRGGSRGTRSGGSGPSSVSSSPAAPSASSRAHAQQQGESDDARISPGRRSTMIRALVLLALATMGCRQQPLKVADGCAGYDGRSCISLEVLSPTGMTLSLDQLELASVNGFAFQPLNDVFSPGTPGAKAALPVVVPVLPPESASGPFTLAVRALNSGAVAGSGTVDGVLVPGRHTIQSVTLAAGAGTDADPSLSTVTIDRTTGIASDGVDAATCTVHLVDASGNALVGRAVGISATPDGADITPSGLTNADGDMTARVTSKNKGTYTLTAVFEPRDSALMLDAAPTISFVTPGKLAFTLQPRTTLVGATMNVQVSVEDPATGEVIADSSTPITLALGSNPVGAGLSGDIIAQPQDGVATFTNINLDAPGDSFTLVASATSLTKGTSTPFDITARAWTHSSAGLDGGYAQRILYDPTHAGTVYATTPSGVYKSLDGGASWKYSSYGAPDATWSLAIDPKTPSTVYASSDGAAVYKTINGGASWKQLQLPPGSYSYGVVVDPSRPSTILDDAMTSILRSDDGGATWTVALPGGTQLTVGAGPIYATDGSGNVTRSTDHGVTWTPSGFPSGGILTADPTQPGTLYGTGGTPSKSIDFGQTWNPISGGLPTGASVHRIGICAVDPSRIYAALESGGVFTSNDGGATWTNGTLTQVSGFVAGADPFDPQRGLFSGFLSGTFRTADGGMTWARSDHGIPAPVRSLLFAPGTFFAATEDGLYQSLNGAGTWTLVSGLPDGVGVHSVVQDLSQNLYAALDSQTPLSAYLERYDAVTHAWAPLDAGATGGPTGPIGLLAIDPGNSAHLFVGGAAGNVYVTMNGGNTSWTHQTLCNGFVTSIIFVGASHTPFATCAASATTDPSGVFTSADGGTTWMSTSAGANGIPDRLGSEGARREQRRVGLLRGHRRRCRLSQHRSRLMGFRVGRTARKADFVDRDRSFELRSRLGRSWVVWHVRHHKQRCSMDGRQRRLCARRLPSCRRSKQREHAVCRRRRRRGL